MIPTIETIVELLVSGQCTKAEAVGWLHQHAQDACYGLRDEFAGLAMQTMCGTLDDGDLVNMSTGLLGGARISNAAYVMADAMLAARDK